VKFITYSIHLIVFISLTSTWQVVDAGEREFQMLAHCKCRRIAETFFDYLESHDNRFPSEQAISFSSVRKDGKRSFYGTTDVKAINSSETVSPQNSIFYRCYDRQCGTSIRTYGNTYLDYRVGGGAWQRVGTLQQADRKICRGECLSNVPSQPSELE
jgi:hypothetical protein